jgi:hypothetical protein
MWHLNQKTPTDRQTHRDGGTAGGGEFGMNRELTIKRFLSAFFLTLFFVFISSCGGGSGGSDSSVSPAGSGDVALLLTDAPSDIFEEINITVVKAELLSDSGNVTIFEGNRTFNLLNLTDAKMFAIRQGVPAGTYSKIRLTLTDMELVDYNDTDNPADDFTDHPKLPGNGKLDLNPQGDFRITSGTTLVIQIDMDANKSIHIVEKGNKDEYQFRPVVFVDIVTDSFEERYVQMHGVIDDIDSGERTFELCDSSIPVQIDENSWDVNSRGCVDVETTDDTALFDINGMPAVFGDLVEGEQATVFGHLRRDPYDDLDDDDDRQLNDLVLVASLIELGPESAFQKLTGTAGSTVDGNQQFTMDVDPGQGLTTPLTLTVQIQDGTRLIDLQGNPVDEADILIGKLVNARGVLDVNADTLFASLIVIDIDTSAQLSGSVGANPDNACGFTLMTSTGDNSIQTDSSTQIFLVTATTSNGSSLPIDVNDLVSGQQADVYGNFVNGCFEADTIIAYELTPNPL